MERKKATDYPQELLNLFDRYVHGEIGRRDFLDGAKKFATGGVTATAIFGWSTGANAMNHAWLVVPRTTSAVPVLPATWKPDSALAVPVPS